MTAKRIRLAAAVLALAAAGVYLFVYLYRWEWHRAILAATFVVIAQVTLLGAIVLDRLRSLERRIDELAATTKDEHDRITHRVQAAGGEPRSPFAWLEPDRMGVFVPVLLGAGVVLSLAAWAVERVARVSAGVAVERSLTRDLLPLAIPSGTLLTGWEAPAPVAEADGRRRRRALVVAASVAAIIAVALAVDAVGDATQNRPDQIKAGSAATMTLQIATLRSGLSDERAAANLWGACSQQLGSRYELSSLTSLGAGRVLLTVTPGIGPNAERRFRGCVQDATTDLVQARITRIASAG